MIYLTVSVGYTCIMNHVIIYLTVSVGYMEESHEDTDLPMQSKLKSNGTHLTLVEDSVDCLSQGRNEQLDSLVNGEKVTVECVGVGQRNMRQRDIMCEEESHPIIQLEQERESNM